MYCSKMKKCTGFRHSTNEPKIDKIEGLRDVHGQVVGKPHHKEKVGKTIANNPK